MKKFKLLNFRLPFAAALALVCGILFSYALRMANAPTYAYITTVPIAAVIFIITVIFAKNNNIIICCLSLIIMFMVGMGNFALRANNYQSTEVSTGNSFTISGNVNDVGQTNKGTQYIIISNAYADGAKLSGKLLAYLNDSSGDYCTIGYKVSFTGIVQNYDLFTYGEINYQATEGVKYYCTAATSLTAKQTFSPFSAIRLSIYDTLFENLDNSTASVAYAMLTGNTQEMSQQTLSSFRHGGIAHIFAVSGLHIGILFGALSLLFKKIKVNKYISTTIIILAILFYAGVCGFSPSSLRAVIMCSVMALSKLLYCKYDSLNSLSIAVILLLLINPLYVFGVGFKLSVGAVLGIIFLGHNLKRLLAKLPYGLRDGLAITLSTQITTFPTLLMSFGYISGAGIILNIVVIPVMSVMFVIMFVSTLLSTIVPIGSLLLPVVSLPLQAVINFAVTFGFENTIISGLGGWWLVIFVFLLMFALSDKFNITKYVRIGALSLTIISFTLTAVLVNYIPVGNVRIIASAYYGGGCVMFKSHYGAVVVVTEELNSNNLSLTLSQYGINNPTDLILLGGEECLESYFNLGITAENIYLSQDLINVTSIGNTNAHYEKDFSLYGLDFTFADSYTLKAASNGISVGICAGEYINLSSVDLLFSVYENSQCQANQTIYFNRIDKTTTQRNIYDSGRLQFTIKNGKII